MEYSYLVIALPPLLFGSLNIIVMEFTPEMTFANAGLSGVVNGITVIAFEPAVDCPFLFSFFTRIVYGVPLVNPLIVYVVALLPVEVYVFPLLVE